MNQFQRFIVEYLNQNHISMSELARRMGIENSTLSRLLQEGTDREPTLTLLFKLAEATGADIRDIVVLLAPASVVHGSSTEAAALAVRFDQLSQEARVHLEFLIRGLSA